mmetsp:Transcript_17189/g.30014  ORF Transcript_17189/g.30014 Transcript_17189/m.30014 type:complete len:84 (+) Transcript_17189:312-563(+)
MGCLSTGGVVDTGFVMMDWGNRGDLFGQCFCKGDLLDFRQFFLDISAMDFALLLVRRKPERRLEPSNVECLKMASGLGLIRAK